MVRIVNQGCVPDIRCGVVNNHIFPFGIGVERNHIAKHPGVGNDQFLADLDRLSWLEAIGFEDALHGNFVHFGEAPNAFHGSHLMHDGPGIGRGVEFFSHNAHILLRLPGLLCYGGEGAADEGVRTGELLQAPRGKKATVSSKAQNSIARAL